MTWETIIIPDTVIIPPSIMNDVAVSYMPRCRDESGTTNTQWWSPQPEKHSLHKSRGCGWSRAPRHSQIKTQLKLRHSETDWIPQKASEPSANLPPLSPAQNPYKITAVWSTRPSISLLCHVSALTRKNIAGVFWYNSRPLKFTNQNWKWNGPFMVLSTN